ncbi:hypothetical protein AYI68_g6399 [Smittium mucronatum]|uniref:Uncharacterized protein n=1 Tax=Smittium mucronatum TaxID=133383 RepID=A0A1R0GRK7_9FUNG|nr:hypothetical protein AYI68_g6399 [Smittium mucronatum]
MKFSLLALTVSLVLGNGIIYHRSFVDGFSFPEGSSSSGFRGGSSQLGQNYDAGYQNEFHPRNVIQNQIRPNIPNFYLNGPINLQNWNPYQAQSSFLQQNLDQQQYSLPAANQDRNTIIGLNELFDMTTASIDNVYLFLSKKMCYMYKGYRIQRPGDLKSNYEIISANINEAIRKFISSLNWSFYSPDELNHISAGFGDIFEEYAWLGELIGKYGKLPDVVISGEEVNKMVEDCKDYLKTFGYDENRTPVENEQATNQGMAESIRVRKLSRRKSSRISNAVDTMKNKFPVT